MAFSQNVSELDSRNKTPGNNTPSISEMVGNESRIKNKEKDAISTNFKTSYNNLLPFNISERQQAIEYHSCFKENHKDCDKMSYQKR